MSNPYPSPDPGAQLRIPGMFCPGRAVRNLPAKPEPGRLYGLRAGVMDWVSVTFDKRTMTYSWCTRVLALEGSGNRSDFDTFMGDMREKAAGL